MCNNISIGFPPFFQGDGQSLIDRFGKLSSVMKSKSVSMKEKMINYIKNEPSNGAVDRCVVRVEQVYFNNTTDKNTFIYNINVNKIQTEYCE